MTLMDQFTGKNKQLIGLFLNVLTYCLIEKKMGFSKNIILITDILGKYNNNNNNKTVIFLLTSKK